TREYISFPARRSSDLAVASRIPWETLNVGGWRPALDRGMSRRYLAEDLSIAKWLEERRQDSSFRILLVVNPTEDLDGAEEEGERSEEHTSELQSREHL